MKPMPDSPRSTSTADGRRPGDRGVLETIRAATREEHERSERAIEGRFFDGSGHIDREGYRELLEAFLGFYRPLEKSLVPAVRRHLPSVSYRRRTRRLERDLRVLGCSDERIDALPTLSSDEMPELDGPPRVLGCLYVVEGAELGGRVMRKRLEDDLDGDALRADAFFGTDPDRVRDRWTSFREEFERRLAPGDRLEEAVSAARATFRALRRGMS